MRRQGIALGKTWPESTLQFGRQITVLREMRERAIVHDFEMISHLQNIVQSEWANGSPQ